MDKGEIAEKEFGKPYDHHQLDKSQRFVAKKMDRLNPDIEEESKKKGKWPPHPAWEPSLSKE